MGRAGRPVLLLCAHSPGQHAKPRTQPTPKSPSDLSVTAHSKGDGGLINSSIKLTRIWRPPISWAINVGSPPTLVTVSKYENYSRGRVQGVSEVSTAELKPWNRSYANTKIRKIEISPLRWMKGGKRVSNWVGQVSSDRNSQHTCRTIHSQIYSSVYAPRRDSFQNVLRTQERLFMSVARYKMMITYATITLRSCPNLRRNSNVWRWRRSIGKVDQKCKSCLCEVRWTVNKNQWDRKWRMEHLSVTFTGI